MHRAWEWLFTSIQDTCICTFLLFFVPVPLRVWHVRFGWASRFCKQNTWHNRTERVCRAIDRNLPFLFCIRASVSTFFILRGILLHLIVDLAERGRPSCYDCYDTMYMTEASVTLCYHLDVIVFLVLIWTAGLPCRWSFERFLCVAAAGTFPTESGLIFLPYTLMTRSYTEDCMIDIHALLVSWARRSCRPLFLTNLLC
jgi:hypothetical protein